MLELVHKDIETIRGEQETLTVEMQTLRDQRDSAEQSTLQVTGTIQALNVQKQRLEAQRHDCWRQENDIQQRLVVVGAELERAWGAVRKVISNVGRLFFCSNLYCRFDFLVDFLIFFFQ